MQAQYIPFIVFASIIGVITIVFIYNRFSSQDDEETETQEVSETESENENG